jgi:hypothetical protein
MGKTRVDEGVPIPIKVQQTLSLDSRHYSTMGLAGRFVGSTSIVTAVHSRILGEDQDSHEDVVGKG